jgi:hypothetical protein
MPTPGRVVPLQTQLLNAFRSRNLHGFFSVGASQGTPDTVQRGPCVVLRSAGVHKGRKAWRRGRRSPRRITRVDRLTDKPHRAIQEQHIDTTRVTAARGHNAPILAVVPTARTVGWQHGIEERVRVSSIRPTPANEPIGPLNIPSKLPIWTHLLQAQRGRGAVIRAHIPGNCLAHQTAVLHSNKRRGTQRIQL